MTARRSRDEMKLFEAAEDWLRLAPWTNSITYKRRMSWLGQAISLTRFARYKRVNYKNLKALLCVLIARKENMKNENSA
jgi:hypothetical protein